jgi:hypothetical protein
MLPVQLYYANKEKNSALVDYLNLGQLLNLSDKMGGTVSTDFKGTK